MAFLHHFLFKKQSRQGGRGLRGRRILSLNAKKPWGWGEEGSASASSQTFIPAIRADHGQWIAQRAPVVKLQQWLLPLP